MGVNRLSHKPPSFPRPLPSFPCRREPRGGGWEYPERSRRVMLRSRLHNALTRTTPADEASPTPLILSLEFILSTAEGKDNERAPRGGGWEFTLSVAEGS